MIYSKRLRLRASEKTDLPQFVTWLNDPEVTRYLLISLPLSITQEEQWFERMSSAQTAEQVLVIEVQVGDGWKSIGNTSFMNIQWTNRNAEIGIFIGDKDYWSKGYGREVMKLMLRHGFNTLNLHRIYLKVYEPNIRGIKAYQYAGFVEEGRLRQDVYRDGRYYDVLVMSVLRHEWQDSDF